MHRKFARKLNPMHVESTGAFESQTCVPNHRCESVNLPIPIMHHLDRSMVMLTSNLYCRYAQAHYLLAVSPAHHTPAYRHHPGDVEAQERYKVAEPQMAMIIQCCFQ
ncbi:hypothetical protein SRHO_G00279870 [Serrasalmus rhombeus]